MTETSTVIVATARFGPTETVAVPATDLYVCPSGLPGLPGHTRFAFLSSPEYAPIGWLQALDEPACCLPVVAAAFVAIPSYEDDLPAVIGRDGAQHAFLVTRYDPATDGFVTNTLAPLVLDPVNGTVQQVVLDTARYVVCQPIVWDDRQQQFVPSADRPDTLGTGAASDAQRVQRGI